MENAPMERRFKNEEKKMKGEFKINKKKLWKYRRNNPGDDKSGCSQGTLRLFQERGFQGKKKGLISTKTKRILDAPSASSCPDPCLAQPVDHQALSHLLMDAGWGPWGGRREFLPGAGFFESELGPSGYDFGEGQRWEESLAGKGWEASQWEWGSGNEGDWDPSGKRQDRGKNSLFLPLSLNSLLKWVRNFWK